LYVEERELKAALYVVPTPIGNIGDMTLRSVEVLQAVDMIAAEDTRHSRTLLNHYEITTPVISFHEHSGESAAVALAERIMQGERIALISDAGTPLVSDPGYQLVRAVQALNMPVVPLPGPCAAVTALSAAGLPTHSFQFVGFLPAKKNARRTRLDGLKSSESTISFTRHRIGFWIYSMISRACWGRCVRSVLRASLRKHSRRFAETPWPLFATGSKVTPTNSAGNLL